jgi:ketosteroid isomerase-like protein
MKKLLMLTLGLVLFLSACGQVVAAAPAASAPTQRDVKVTRSVLDKYMAAMQAYDAATLVSLYSTNIAWVDYGNSFGPLRLSDMSYFYQHDLKSTFSDLKFTSSFVTLDGRFAVAQASFSRIATSTNTLASSSAVIVLEFMDDKIVNESWYYDESPIH